MGAWRIHAVMFAHVSIALAVHGRMMRGAQEPHLKQLLEPLRWCFCVCGGVPHLSGPSSRSLSKAMPPVSRRFMAAWGPLHRNHRACRDRPSERKTRATADNHKLRGVGCEGSRLKVITSGSMGCFWAICCQIAAIRRVKAQR